MVIDFHTHVFPERIASRTIAMLSQKGEISPFSDGTIAGLLTKMEQSGVDASVNLPVLTSPTQFDSVNRFALEINQTMEHHAPRLISFGGIHPACEDIDGKMRFLRKNGFLGVKIHPDYQETYINNEGYVKIMESAKEYDMIVVTHSGVDDGYRDRPVRCTPDLALELIHRVPHKKLVLAHYGANELWEDTLKNLCDADVYFDTAYMLRFIDEDLFKKILLCHGEDRVLFASDSPWSDMGKDVSILKSFSLGQKTEEKIFCENAKRLLGM